MLLYGTHKGMNLSHNCEKQECQDIVLFIQ